MILRSLLILGGLAAFAALGADPAEDELIGPPAPAVQAAPIDPREAAKREGWALAQSIVAILEQGDNSGFPAIRAWLEDFHRAGEKVQTSDAAKPFPGVDVDALTTRNPRFWSAYYEMAPGDPGVALLYSALLLSGGEAQRAAALAAFGLQRTGVPDEFKRSLAAIISHAQAAQARSFDFVRDGVRLHDARDFAAALKKYDAALEEWPANGWAHYERGFTLRMKAMAGAERTAAKATPAATSEPVDDPPETRTAFIDARRHDPFQVMAYQGDEPDVLAGLMALVRTGLPIWETIRKHPEQALSREQLRDLADACREARIEDFALALRQLLVARTRKYQPDDVTFIAECLGRCVPGVPITTTLARLNSDAHPEWRQIVATSAERDNGRTAKSDEMKDGDNTKDKDKEDKVTRITKKKDDEPKARKSPKAKKAAVAKAKPKKRKRT